MMSKEEAREYASRWLPAWTGNNPEKLASFYADDALYLDPSIPQGVKGKGPLLLYFRKLPGQNPIYEPDCHPSSKFSPDAEIPLTKVNVQVNISS